MYIKTDSLGRHEICDGEIGWWIFDSPEVKKAKEEAKAAAIRDARLKNPWQAQWQEKLNASRRSEWKKDNPFATLR